MQHDVLRAQSVAAGLAPHPQRVITDYLALPDTRNTSRGMVASGGLSPLLGALYLTVRPTAG